MSAVRSTALGVDVQGRAGEGSVRSGVGRAVVPCYFWETRERFDGALKGYTNFRYLVNKTHTCMLTSAWPDK